VEHQFLFGEHLLEEVEGAKSYWYKKILTTNCKGLVNLGFGTHKILELVYLNIVDLLWWINLEAPVSLDSKPQNAVKILMKIDNEYDSVSVRVSRCNSVAKVP
jgi:hypothetical protein